MPESDHADMERGVPPLREIYLYLTGGCNLNCRHCWISPVYENETERWLPWADLLPIFEEARELGLGAVKITGGEPFLHPEILDVLGSVKEMGLRVRVETNGTLVGEKEARVIREVKAAVAISLDGTDAEMHDRLRGVKGAFEQALEGARCLKAEDIPFQVIMSLHRGNREQIFQMPEFVAGLGARSFKINPITGMTRSDELARGGELLSVREILLIHEKLLARGNSVAGVEIMFDIPPAFKPRAELMANPTCSCGVLNILGVLHDGHGGLCGIGERVEELDFGDLRELGVKKVWVDTPALNELREKLPRGLEGICGRCMLKHYCLGKCVARTYYDDRTLTGAFSFCREADEEGVFPESRRLGNGD